MEVSSALISRLSTADGSDGFDLLQLFSFVSLVPSMSSLFPSNFADRHFDQAELAFACDTCWLFLVDLVGWLLCAVPRAVPCGFPVTFIHQLAVRPLCILLFFLRALVGSKWQGHSVLPRSLCQLKLSTCTSKLGISSSHPDLRSES